MRKLLTMTVIFGLLLALSPVTASAGDTHAVRNRWAGVGIGVAVATLGGLLWSGFHAPVAAAPMPLPYMPPAVVYTPPPIVYALPPPVVYSRAPVAAYRGWGPPGHWRHYHRR